MRKWSPWRRTGPTRDPIAAALHANVANIEAVMIAGQWRKRDQSLLVENVEDVKCKLLESGERLVHHNAARP